MRTLDPTDRQILSILQQDARQELSVISRLVYRSPSSVSERIRKLQEEGIIKRYVAVIDPNKIGQQMLAVTHVSLSVHTTEILNEFRQIAEQLPEVQLCLHLSGACDFILHIAVPDTQTYYHLRCACRFQLCVQRMQNTNPLTSWNPPASRNNCEGNRLQ